MANFYSDTQTQPTAEMRATVLTAVVGDEQRSLDPTTAELERRVAHLLGKEAAIFMPSGTMCNEIAIRVHTDPGDEVICERASHLIGFEAGGPAANSGVMIHALDGQRGTFTAEQVRGAVRSPSRYAPRSRLVSIEQTANLSGGTVWPIRQIDEVAEAAKEAGLTTHMDGARLMNAVVASGVPAARQARDMDSCWIDLTKGLGAPIGAVLAGTSQFIEAAWRLKQQWGGAMRQSGVVAAMGLYALDHHIDRLAKDHARAAHIAHALERMAGVAYVAPVDSNIVIFDTATNALTGPQLVTAAAREGIQIGSFSDRRCRIVTHHDVNDTDVELLLGVLGSNLV